MPRAGVARRVNGRQRELQRLGNRYFCFVERPKGSVDITASVCFGDALAPNFGSIPPTMWRQTMTEMDVDAAHQSSCAYGDAAPKAGISETLMEARGHCPRRGLMSHTPILEKRLLTESRQYRPANLARAMPGGRISRWGNRPDVPVRPLGPRGDKPLVDLPTVWGR